MRGTELFSDNTVTNVVVKDSTIRVEVDDTDTTQAAAIVTQGTSNADHRPITYENNRIVSNICNVRFGNCYGRGHNHKFVGCTFSRTGDNASYHTFIFDGGYSTGGHTLLDCSFEGGAAYDDVYWEQTGDLSHYSVQWTLTLSAEAGANVEVNNAQGEVAFSGTVEASGTLRIPLIEAIVRPAEWTPSATGGGVRRKDEHQVIRLTPHTVRVVGTNTRTETLDMTAPTSLSL